jgi:SWI/SNF-related matrix-associated actin-dependent regulator 1 of chromatin subfamily A
MLQQCLSGYSLPKEILVESGKFQKLDEMLPKLKSEGHRVLIFSQFVIMLDVLQEYLHIRGHRYLRLDGSTPVTSRFV